MKNIKEKITLENVIMVGIFIIVSITLFWKCRYGCAFTTDEGFYPTFANRLLQGDRLLYDEWHVTQLSAVIIMPFLKLFLIFNGSTEGVYLYFRYLYTILKIIISMFAYVRLKRYSKICAYVSALTFMIYAGHGWMVVSYNSIQLGASLVAFLLFLNDKDCLKSRIYWVLSGVALAVSVLGIPYNAIIYVAFFIAVVVLNCFYKKAEKNGKHINETIRLCFSYKVFGFVTIGVALSAIAFFVYIFSQITFSQLVSAIPEIMAGDSEHMPKSLYHLTVMFLVRLVRGNSRNWGMFAIFVLMGIIAVMYLCDKKKAQRRTGYIIAATVAAIALQIEVTVTIKYLTSNIYVPNVLAVLLVIFAMDEKIKELFATIVVPGFLVVYAEYAASVEGFWGMASASCVASMGSVMIIMLVLMRYMSEAKNLDALKKIASGALSAFLALTAGLLLYYRVAYVYRSDGLASLTVTTEYGVAKGLIVTSQQYTDYTNMYNDTESIRNMPNETKVAYFADCKLWMAGTQRCATHSTYCNRDSVRSYMEQLYRYWQEQPDKIADVIYVDKKFGQDIADELAEKYGYRVKEMTAGWILTEK